MDHIYISKKHFSFYLYVEWNSQFFISCFIIICRLFTNINAYVFPIWFMHARRGVTHTCKIHAGTYECRQIDVYIKVRGDKALDVGCTTKIKPRSLMSEMLS